MEQNIKECANCHKVLPADYAYNICPKCKEDELFSRVKDYIRTHEVNEYMVANEFQIPLRKVRGWIKEGRIEYKERGAKTIMSSFCQRCGAEVTFGTLCQKCLKEMNDRRKGYKVENSPAEQVTGEIRYLKNVED